MILVTGARGVVGQPLCKSLEQSARQYLAVSRKDKESDHHLSWNLLEPLSQTQVKRISACNALIHCAPLWLLPMHFSSLVEAGIQRVVAFSSTSVIAKKTSSDPQEKELVKLLQDAENKLTELALKHQVALTILRPSMIYGNGLDENISHIARRIRRLKIMPLAGQAYGLRQPVHADDLVDAAFTVLEQQTVGVKDYNLAGGETLSYRMMVTKIFQAMDITPRFIIIPLWLFRVLLRMLSLFGSFNYTASMANRMNADLVYDFEAARNNFGYEPQAFLLHPERDLPK